MTTSSYGKPRRDFDARMSEVLRDEKRAARLQRLMPVGGWHRVVSVLCVLPCFGLMRFGLERTVSGVQLMAQDMSGAWQWEAFWAGGHDAVRGILAALVAVRVAWYFICQIKTSDYSAL